MDGLDTGGFTGNETGMGQGLAYVLPQSRSVGYFMQLANERAQQARDNAAALQAQQQKANEQYAQHLYATKTPDIAKDYSQYLQPKFDSLLNDMAQYHAKTGQDPYTNPDFVKQFNDLSTVAKNTHEANLQHTAYAAQIADKSKNYTPESKQAGIDWLNKYQTNPVSMLYSPPPPLEERNLDLNDAVKLGHATPTISSQGGYTITAPNRHNHIVQGQAILSQPEFAPYLQSAGINPTIGDIGGIPNGTGGTLYPTDDAHVNAISDHILQNANQPHYAQTLAAAGIDPLDPHAKDKLVDVVKRQNAGYGKVYSQFADRLDANVETKKVPDYGEDRLAISEGNYELAKQRLALQQEKEGKNTTPIYRQNWVSGMLSGDPNSGEQLKAKIDADPSYDKNSYDGLGFHIGTMGNKIALNVPAKTTLDKDGTVVEKIPQRQIVIDKNDPNADIKLNEAVNQLTGEKVDISALRTQGGKKHLPTVNNNTPITNKNKRDASAYGL